MKFYIFSVVYVTLCVSYIKTITYEMIGQSKHFFEPCGPEDRPSNFGFEEIFDITNVTHYYDDDIIYTSGDVIAIQSFPDDVPIKAELEVLHWVRGQWINTILYAKRDDLCKDLFNENRIDFWTTFLLSIPKEQRKCPPKAGDRYTMRNTSNRIVFPNMPDKLDGRFKIVLHVYMGNVSGCLVVPIRSYKIENPTNDEVLGMEPLE